MNSHECALAVCLHSDMKPYVEEAIARFIEADARIRSPIYMEVTIQLDA